MNLRAKSTLALLAVSILLILRGEAASANEPPSPNILFILVDDFTKKEQPWLVYLSFYVVRGPFVAKEEKVEKYREKFHQVKEKKRFAVEYAAMVESMDENVGRVLRWLDEKQLRWGYLLMALFGIYLVATAIFEMTGQWSLVFPRYIADPEQGIHFGRARGPMVQSARLGLYLIACLAATWILLFWQAHWGRIGRLIAVALAPLYAGAAFLTYTRSVWMGLAASTLLLVGLTLRGKLRLAILGGNQEGIKFNFLASPVHVLGDEHGRVTHLEYRQIELGEPDESGRRRPVPIEGSETLLQIDMLITAIGQAPDLSFRNDSKRLNGLKVSRWNTIDADPEILQSSIPYVFVGGDLVAGSSLVVEAIGGGRRAARSIHMYLMGEDVTPPEKTLFDKNIPGTIFESVPGIVKSKRTELPELPVDERIKSFVEADLVISEEEAQYESRRCLNCCLQCYNKDAA